MGEDLGLFGKKSAFVSAIREGNLDAVKALLEQYPDYISMRMSWYDDSDDMSYSGDAISMAANFNQPAVIEFLVKEKGVPAEGFDGENNSSRWTPLFEACRYQRYEAAEMLLKLGADPDRKGNNGYPPAIYCRTEKLQRLLNPATGFAQDGMDKIRARIEKYPDYAKKWRHAGDDVKDLVNGGDAVLHVAARHGRGALLEMLVGEKKAPVDLRNEETGWTALHYAVAADRPVIAALLLHLGADPELKTKQGKLASDFCRSDEMKELFVPVLKQMEEEARRARQREEEEEALRVAKEAAGTWRCLSSAEVMRERKLPGDGLVLTDIFNFETRRWTALAKDQKSGHLTQSILFFDDVADREELRRACAKLAELGGSPDPGSVDGSVLQKQKGIAP